MKIYRFHYMERREKSNVSERRVVCFSFFIQKHIVIMNDTKTPPHTRGCREYREDQLLCAAAAESDDAAGDQEREEDHYGCLRSCLRGCHVLWLGSRDRCLLGRYWSLYYWRYDCCDGAGAPDDTLGMGL